MGLFTKVFLVFLTLRFRSSCREDLDFEEKWITRPPTEYEFPHAIYIVVNSIEDACSGVLVSDSWVLTAACCVYKDGTTIIDNVDLCMTLYAGVKNRSRLDEPSVQMRSSVRVRLPNEQRGCHDHSPAAVRVDTPFVLNRKLGVDLIPLSKNSYGNTDHYQCKGASYGNIHWDDPAEYLIKKIDLKVQECNCTKELQEAFPKSHVDRLICGQSAGSAGICKGDFGLGMICDGALQAICVGLIQFEVNSCKVANKHSKNCWRDNSKGLFVDVCFYLKWMNQIIPGIPLNDKTCGSTGHRRDGSPTLGVLCPVVSMLLRLSLSRF